MNDETRRHSQRITRRSFLLGSVVTAGAGAAAVAVGYARGRGRGAAGATRASKLAPAGSRGGVLRAYNFDAIIPDALDPHLTQMGPVVDLHSAVFSRLLRYEDERAGTLAPDLCDGMPEQPDKLTYVIKLRSGATFHDTPAFRLAHPDTAGRALRAADVKYSIERQVNAASPQAGRFFRADAWGVVDSLEARDARTLVVTLKTPTAPFLQFLAGRHAFVIPQGVTDANDELRRDLDMIGSGPFLLDAWQPGGAGSLMRLRRNPSWFAADDLAATAGRGRPFLEGYEAYVSPQQDLFDQMAFERKRVDTTDFTDVAALAREQKTNLADILLEQTDAGGVLASRLLLDRAPFKDDRVRRALHLAVDRRALASALYPALDGTASAKLSGSVAPVSPWALDPAELLKRPGYRGGAGRDQDVREAKQLWAAAGGSVGIGDLRMSVAGVPAVLGSKAADLLQQGLQQTLGVKLIAGTDASGYAFIAAALRRNLAAASEGVVPFTLAFEDGGVDLDEWLYAQYRSGQSQNTYRLQDATLDAMLDKQRQEFDAEARRSQGLAIQDYLLANVNARLDYLAPVSRRVTWGYVRNSTMPIWYGSLERLADTWLDQSHDAWSGRQ